MRNLWLTILFSAAMISLHSHAEEDIQPIVDQFFADMDKYSQLVRMQPNPKFKVQFDRDVAGIHGSCIRREDEESVISLNTQHWDSMNAARRKAVIYHELGHCVLLRGHTEAGIMNPNGVDEITEKNIASFFNAIPDIDNE